MCALQAFFSHKGIKVSRSHTRAGVATEIVHNRQNPEVLPHLPATAATLVRYGAHTSCPLNPEPRILSGVYHRIV
jgi:hypothetical protein